VGEVWIEDEEVTLGVGPRNLPGYQEQSITRKLTPGVVNEVTIRLAR
jgi:hypothetical protein